MTMFNHEFIENKAPLRAKIEKDVEEYLANGGTIKEVPIMIRDYSPGRLITTLTKDDHLRSGRIGGLKGTRANVISRKIDKGEL